MPVEGVRAHDVSPEKQQHNQAQQQEVTVVIVQDPGEARLTVVAAALQLLDGACGRVPEKRPKVGLAVVIATASEPERDDREDWNQDANEGNLDETKSQPGREERGNIRVIRDVDLVEDRPGGVDHK